MSATSRLGLRGGVVALVVALTLTLLVPTAGAVPTAGNATTGPSSARQAEAPATENYVAYVYGSLLFREVDAEALLYWSAIVDTQGAGAFVNFVVSSPEWRKAWVDAFYEFIWLERTADPDALEYWEEYLRGNRFDGFERIVGVSQEAYALAGGTPETYVEYLFQATLFRSPTPEQSLAAQAVLAAEGRDTLVGYLLVTDEGLGSRVSVAYEQTLEREPDVGGAGYWMDLYHDNGSLGRMLAGMILSPEAWAIAQNQAPTARELGRLTRG